MNKAIFLDRDGTINIEKNYLYKKEEFEFIAGMPKAIKKWNDLGYLVLVITNQAGIARGFYEEVDVDILHKHINRCLKKVSAHIDGFYFCPHHPTEGIGKYKVECNCRKPNTGLLEKAIKDFNVDISKSYLFGNKGSDIEAGNRIGVQTFLVDSKSFDIDIYPMFNLL